MTKQAKKQESFSRHSTPILTAFVSQGIVWYDGANYLGRAGDGVIVNLSHDAVSAERYLQAHPNPSDW